MLVKGATGDKTLREAMTTQIRSRLYVSLGFNELNDHQSFSAQPVRYEYIRLIGPGECVINLKSVFFKLILRINISNISFEIGLT